MAESHLRSITASQLRFVLIGSMALLLAITIAAFWYFRSELINYAQQVQNDNAKAVASSSDISRLKTLKLELAKDQDAVARTKSIVADSQYYQYQNQIIADINSYAKSAGVTLSGYTFNDAAVAPTTSGAASTPTASVASLKSVSVSIGIKSPLEYKSLLQFIHYIEVNLTKMQISGIALTKAQSGGSEVSADQITVQVYTR